MRIIGGLARGTKLSSFSGRNIRPTSDRVREAVFSILYSRIGSFSAKKVLDLFAGTGAQALEALSRGAESAVAVERSRKAAAMIESNARTCNLAKNLEVICADVSASMPGLKQRGPFDLIFLDPPYDRDLLPPTLELIERFALLTQEGIICAESAKKEKIPEAVGRLERVDTRHYGSTAVHIFHYSKQGGMG